jgi:hypothetical protein
MGVRTPRAKILLAAGLALTSCGAMAEGLTGLTLGGAANAISSELNVLPDMLGGASYLLGAAHSIKALLTFHKHSDDPRNHPLPRAAVQLAVSGLLFALPSTIGAGMGTLFGADAKSSLVGVGTAAEK